MNLSDAAAWFKPLLIRGTRLPPLLAIYEPPISDEHFSAFLRRLPPGCGVIFRGYGMVQRAQRLINAAALSAGRGIAFFPAVRHAGDIHILPLLSYTDIPVTGVYSASGLNGALNSIIRTYSAGVLISGAHSLHDIYRLKERKTDTCLLSPLFPTQSHPGESYLGRGNFSAIVAAAGIPAYALGGITTPVHIKSAVEAGARGIASIRLFSG